MNIRITCLALSILYTLSVQSAEQPLTIEHDQEEQCLVCLHSYKKMAYTSFNTSIIDTFSSPISAICQGLLVLAQTNKQLWTLAIIIEIGHGNKIKIHLCNNHTLCQYNKKKIRQLQLLWSLLWQPEQPKARALSTIQSYINQFKRTNPKPYTQTMCIDPSMTIYVIGDIHGSSKSLSNFLKNLNIENKLDSNLKLDPDTYIVCTGDYTDRGPHGVRVWHILCLLKLINPSQVFLIRGNHETFSVHPEGFLREWCQIMQTYPSTANIKMLENLFSSLPQAVFLGIKDPHSTQEHPSHHFLMFCHGGIDYAVPIQKILKDYVTCIQTTPKNILMQHAFDHTNPEFSGLLWSDFVANNTEDEPALSWISSRGNSMLKFNSTAAAAYLKEQSSDNPENQFDINALVSGHQHVPGGIVRLKKTRTDNSDWVVLQHNLPEYIEQGSVYTCISSPDGLADFGCFEDSFAKIEWESTSWKITPHIVTRIPKKFLRKIQNAYKHP